MVHRNKYYSLLFLYMAGFLLGIVYANFASSKYVTTTGIFHEFFLGQYANQQIVAEQYFIYLIKQRTLPLALLGVAGMTRFRKIAGAVCLLWTGFAGGILAVAAVMRMGIIGMLFYVAALFPQILFYGFAYAIVINYFMESENIRWNGWKMGTVVIMMFAGIVVETYMNPSVVKWMLEIFSSIR